MLDWEKNVDPEFGAHNRRFPAPVRDEAEMKEAGYREVWVSYGTALFSAKELTDPPGRSTVIRDAAAYGLILTQGRGRIGVLDVETPSMIRFGEMTADEAFVSAPAAREGVRITNNSKLENLVVLKHFGPGNPDAAHLIRE
jgi:hypothetical protein